MEQAFLVDETSVTLPTRARRGVLTIASLWLLALVVGFFLNRGEDAGRLAALLRSLGASLAGEPAVGLSGLAASAGGLLIAGLIVLAWFGLGHLVMRLGPADDGRHAIRGSLALASRCLCGAALWSLVWFGLGVAGLYRGGVAVAALVLGLALALLARGDRADSRPADARARPARPASPGARAFTLAASALSGLALTLALLAALAPPTARDALFYHLAIPKAYVAAGASVVVPYNMATYYPQGVEMQVVWAMLLGQWAGPRVAETAAGAIVFAFAPLLVLTVYGWARERGLDPSWASLAALMIASVPTVYDGAGSGYVDLALTAYAALAIRAAARWWTTLDRAWVIPLAVAVAGALSIKLTAGFLFLFLSALVLFRAAVDHDPGDVSAEPSGPRSPSLAGAGALGLGALLAAPWYLRTWTRTGSPVFPFYLNIWPGHAPGWDAERSRLYQSLLSMYGGARSALDYVLAPVRLSWSAQPDQPAHYDGVLGVAFLFALPFLGWALYRRRLDAELRLAVLASTVLFAFWLFSSEQLRFLLPALPGFAVAMAAAGRDATRTLGARAWLRWLFLGSASVGVVVVLAWFAELAPIRVVLGAEPRSAYLARRLDYYPYYQLINQRLAPTDRVWLINMRRDTYHLDRPYFSDFVFEDYTLTQHVREAQDVAELRARTRAAGITHLLVRHDVIFDYTRSPIVDDGRSREDNLARLGLAARFFQDGTRLMRGDQKFWLIELPAGPVGPPTR
jgi:hypothetical protein